MEAKSKLKPSIHILEEDLVKLLSTYFDIPKARSKRVTRKILLQAKNMSLARRAVLIDPNDEQSLRDTLIRNNVADDKVTMVNKAFLAYRLQAMHRKNIYLFRKGSREYVALQSITSDIEAFHRKYMKEESLRAAALKYIEVYHKGVKPTQFRIQWMAEAYPQICKHYESHKAIESDDNPMITLKIHDLYVALVAEQTGLQLSYVQDKTQYRYFALARDAAKQLGVKPNVYIRGIFDGMEWTGSFPEPKQLITPNAATWVAKYISKL